MLNYWHKQMQAALLILILHLIAILQVILKAVVNLKLKKERSIRVDDYKILILH
jgi:hypothetical protein